MRIWVARHGQTNLNLRRLMQGRTDEPLNDTGIRQARGMRRRIGPVRFDAVYASPLQRAVLTAMLVGDVGREEVITDERITEVDFGRYEKKSFLRLGPAMTLYWALPEIFPAPAGVETKAQMIERSASFLRDLERKEYSDVLVACHGGIMRALSGYLTDRRNGLMWRPRPTNCEIRVFESEDGRHRLLRRITENG